MSLLRQPPGWLSGTTEASRGLIEIDGAGGCARQSPEERVARAYGAFCDGGGTPRPEPRPTRDYEALPAAVWEMVAPHFSLPVDARQRAEIEQAARMNAKAPLGSSREFAPDAATKQAAASLELRRAIDRFARPHLERLVRLHAG